MKLIHVILLSLAAVSLVIGIHRTLTEGFMENYWLFMLSLLFLMLFRYQKPKNG